MTLPSRQLGSTGVEVSALGLGGAWLGLPAPDVSDCQAIESVRFAVEHGINYIDTSPAYQESERRIGLALAGGYRDRVVLATKTGTRPERRGDYSWDATHWSVGCSLELLQTDRLDVVMVHDPPGPDPVFAEGGVLDALEALKAEGVLQFIGIGVRKHDLLRRCIHSGRFDLILTYLDYNLISQTAMERVMPEATEQGVSVVNGSPLAMGLLTEEGPRAGMESGRLARSAPERELELAAGLRRWCQAREIPLPALALQYSMANPYVSVTLNGTKSPRQMAHSLACATTPLPENVWQELAADCGVPPPPSWPGSEKQPERRKD